ncbi:hypothetical protein ABRQ05_12740 [Pectobacterium actinidiae]|uniref:hypothetical protein n=1 Tax=Pectobacterium actinidiae TaxID=1507808 RepID=UPI0032EC8F69
MVADSFGISADKADFSVHSVSSIIRLFMYILDTSALRGISRKNLEDAAKNHVMSISTISILEMASHLNDSPAPSKFLRLRGNFLKCKNFNIIDDPFWVLSEKINLSVNITRKEDKYVLLQLIKLVEDSTTQDELSQKKLTFPNGDTALCNYIGEDISKILKEEENRYIDDIYKMAKKIDLPPSMNGKHVLTEENLISAQIMCAEGLAGDMKIDSRVSSFCATCIYTGYILSRLYFYANARSRGIEEFAIDRNDCEDAYICLNLDISNDNILVTNDKGTISAIKNTIKLLNTSFNNQIMEDRVIDTTEFLARVKP